MKTADTQPIAESPSFSADTTGLAEVVATELVELANGDTFATRSAPVANREVVVTVDDVLIEGGKIAPFHEAGPNYVAMGRFGNVMLTGGEADLRLEARAGEVVRFYLTNTANTRIFNVRLPGGRMKLVG